MIVDASIASHWFVQTDFSSAADPYRFAARLIAPEFLLVETANVLYKQSRAGRIAADRCVESIDVLAQSLSEIVPNGRLLAKAIDLALTHNHPVYDCLYLALAIETSETLVTADRKLAGRAKALSLPVELIEPDIGGLGQSVR